MQHTNTTRRHSSWRHTSQRTLLSRFGLIAVAVATSLGGLAMSSSAAFASRSTPPVVHDDPMAPIAAQAVIDLLTLQSAGSRGAADSADVAIVAAARDRYLASRDTIAAEIANRLGVDATLMQQAWAAADYPHQTALMAAMSQLGVRYRRNTSEPGIGFDCSGLTSYAWGVAGVTLAHQSRTQINNAAKRTVDTAQAGDLAYYPGHVMIYLGVPLTMVHAPFTGRTVEVANVGSRRSIHFGDPLR